MPPPSSPPPSLSSGGEIGVGVGTALGLATFAVGGYIFHRKVWLRNEMLKQTQSLSEAPAEWPQTPFHTNLVELGSRSEEFPPSFYPPTETKHDPSEYLPAMLPVDLES